MFKPHIKPKKGIITEGDEMVKKKKDIGLKQATMGIVGGSVILGAGSSVVSGVGGSTAGLTAAAGFLPPIGATIGAGLTLRELEKLKKVGKRR